jgi:hypothetical protein
MYPVGYHMPAFAQPSNTSAIERIHICSQPASRDFAIEELPHEFIDREADPGILERHRFMIQGPHTRIVKGVGQRYPL